MESVNRAHSPTVRPLAVFGATLLFALVVMRTAWLGDDAFITLRTVSNFLAGFGPVWNVGERVQSYTHPLWMLLLTAGIRVSGEYYYTTILISTALSVTALWLLFRRLCLAPANLLIVATAAILSKALTDYATSGLENPLTYLLIALFFIDYFLGPDSNWKLFRLSLWTALLGVNRLDAMVLLLPALLYAAYGRRARPLPTLGMLLLGALPLLFWELFALFYYGFPLPNTAYAKLNTGLPAADVFSQSWHYFLASVSSDPLTVAGIIVGLALPVLMRDRARLPIAIGIALYLLYIVRIGGDFMTGRFFAAPYLCALVIVARQPLPAKRRWEIGIAWACVLFIGLWNPAQSPVFSARNYAVGAIAGTGIADERGHYYPRFGLLRADRSNRLVERGIITGREDPALFEHCGIGLRGFTAGPQTHIIDSCGLADPLLARLPAQYDPGWRVGHPLRTVPEGYRGTIRTGESAFDDADLAAYYDALTAVVSGPLWSLERLHKIWRFNTGDYDGLIDRAFYRFPDVESYRHADLIWLLERTAEEGGSASIAFDHNGLSITFPDVVMPTHIDLGANLDYAELHFYLDGVETGRADVATVPVIMDGEPVQVVAVPPSVTRAGFDKVVAMPGKRGEYTLSHFAALNIAEPEALKLIQLARLYTFVYYHGSSEDRQALPALHAAMDAAPDDAWNALAPALVTTLLQIPDPALQQSAVDRRRPITLLDDAETALLRYWGAGHAPVRIVAEDESVHAGLKLDLYFETLARFPTDYTVWFHITANDSDDQYMIYDHEPMARTTDWPRRDLFRFSPKIKLPPGSYDISFGLWTPGDRRRLTVDGADAYWINLGAFEVPEPAQIP